MNTQVKMRFSIDDAEIQQTFSQRMGSQQIKHGAGGAEAEQDI